jgi:hypothetical protein
MPLFAVCALVALALQGPSVRGPVLTVEGDAFAVDGARRFLLFVSYFDGVRQASTPEGLARLEGDFEYLSRTVRVDGIRVMPNWWRYSTELPTPDGNVKAVDTLFDPAQPAALRPAPLAALKTLIERAAAHGLIVDVTFTRETLTPDMNADAYREAVVAAARELAPYRNVLFDIQNEFDKNELTPAAVGAIRAAVNAPGVDPARIVIASTTSGSTEYEPAGRIAAGQKLWAIAHHEDRRETWHEEAVVRAVIAALRAGAAPAVMPVYLQEPMPWSLDEDSTDGHFASAARNAKKAGAAAWTFHQRVCFNLQEQSFKARLWTDPAMKAELERIRTAVEAEAWGAGRAGR